MLPIASTADTATVLLFLPFANVVSQAGWGPRATTLARTAYRNQWTAVFVYATRAMSALGVTASVLAMAMSLEELANATLDGVGHFVIIPVARVLVRTVRVTVSATAPCMSAPVIMAGLQMAAKYLIVLEILTVRTEVNEIMAPTCN